MKYMEVENMNISKRNIHKISIAPMLGITNRHYRNMMRFITRETCLYTEMIHHDAILYCQGNKMKNEIEISEIEKPIVIQLGGNNPETLEKIALLCKEYNFDEININCGCPSSKVQNYNFGACLMKDPEVVADLAKRIRNVSNLEVTVKCRLGLNEYSEEFLNDFISNVSSKGQVSHFIMHARLAIMDMDTDKNRKIPPLQHDTVRGLKKIYPHLNFSLNGGIKTLEEIDNLLKCQEYYGVMIGRAAYEKPWMFADVDRRFFNKPNPSLSRKEVVLKYADYCEKVMLEHPEIHFHFLIKPLTFLFSGEKYNSIFKNLLYSYKDVCIDISLKDHIKNIIEKYEKINYRAVNKKPGEK